MATPILFHRGEFDWECPHCGRAVTISGRRHSLQWHTFDSSGLLVTERPSPPRESLITEYIECPRPSCRQRTIFVYRYLTGLMAGKGGTHERVEPRNGLLGFERFFPAAGKVFPAYIPEALREDYTEACRIRELSPKSAATLARRCLQGIIRDYWGIRKRRLVDEVNELEKLVGTELTKDTWAAIDAVRTVGNIGAHMERDVDLVIPVSPDEAQLLIKLIETLFQDCYVARHERQEHAKALIRLADEKNSARQRKRQSSNDPPE